MNQRNFKSILRILVLDEFENQYILPLIKAQRHLIITTLYFI
jgi:hypothetical protein